MGIVSGPAKLIGHQIEYQQMSTIKSNIIEGKPWKRVLFFTYRKKKRTTLCRHARMWKGRPSITIAIEREEVILRDRKKC